MTKIYELQNEQWAIFFARGTQLILQYKEGERIGRPILLANDYGSGFKAVYYEGTLYYLYVNDNGDVLLRNIRDNLVYYQIRHMDSVESGDQAYVREKNGVLHMCVYEGELVLWYLRDKMQGASRNLQCVYPFKPQLGRVIFEEIPAGADIRMLRADSALFLLWTDEQKEEVYRVEQGLQLRKLTMQEPSFAEEQKQKLEAALEEVCRLKHMLEERGKNLQDKDRQVKALQGMIDSASRQYEELMHVAEQYRDEAIKWRSKFIF